MMRIPSLRQRWLAVAAATLVATVVWQLSGKTPIQLFQSDAPAREEEPDTYVVGSTYLTFDETGRLRSRLTVDRAEHYPNSDEGRLTNPRLHIYTENGGPWELTSQQGRLLIPQDQVHLSGFVTVTGQEPGGRPLRFDAPAVIYDDRSRFIRTDQPVTINSQFNQLSAVGMEFDVDQKRLRLFSQVEGIYVNP